ncbi:uncharacterized protein LOC132199220 [Neocloeon triangulifer]|uniref:uncharacterized protein LOC132199220 n=1 Tax=Neocloeon triangulifer TaxID=2078957 RepID=UPI00286F7F53|nr:uncharacterized protein LOC132199220 [Neocloeon triangulifer]
MKAAVALVALCLAQALASPIQAPLEPEGDLNMPGFTMLNMALESGLIDLPPGLARMPSKPTDDLARCLADFFEEMAFSCYFYGRKQMAEDFLALRDMAPDIEQLAVQHNVVPETWDFLLAMRSEGLSVVNLRTYVADTIEFMNGDGGDLITEIRTQVNDLKSHKQELIAVKVAVKKLAEELEKQFSLQISDIAEILRLISYQLGDLGNNREDVSDDMMAIFKAFNKQKRDLYNAAIYMKNEWKLIEKDLKRLVGSDAVAPISANVKLLGEQINGQMTMVTSTLLKTINDSRASYEAMRVLFPGIAGKDAAEF